MVFAVANVVIPGEELTASPQYWTNNQYPSPACHTNLSHPLQATASCCRDESRPSRRYKKRLRLTPRQHHFDWSCIRCRAASRPQPPTTSKRDSISMNIWYATALPASCSPCRVADGEVAKRLRLRALGHPAAIGQAQSITRDSLPVN